MVSTAERYARQKKRDQHLLRARSLVRVLLYTLRHWDRKEVEEVVTLP